MIQNKKRLWALLLSAALIVTQLPAVAMAENNTPEDNVLKDGSIASFDSLDSSVANQTVDVGTEFSGLYLPNLVTASVYQVTKDMVISDEDSSNKDSPNEDSSNKDSPNKNSTNEDSTDEDVTEVSNDISTASGVEGSVSAGNAGDSSGKDSGKTVTAITTSKGEIPVKWDSEPAYDGDIEGKYVFTADVGSYVLSGSAKLPQITVTVTGEILEKEEKIPPKEPLPCKQTGGCTLADGHEGECVTGQLPAVEVLLGVAKTYGLNNTSEESGIKIVAGNNGEVEYTKGSGFTLKASGDYTIFGTWSGNLDIKDSYSNKAVITVPGGVAANVMLKDVTINLNDAYRGAFAVEAGGTANITLSGTNTFTGGDYRAGLDVPENAEMTITHESTGELYVSGGEDSVGIGNSPKGSSRTTGKITINGGVVTAVGGFKGAGIGGSRSVNGGTIIINDGVVTAIGGGGGSGIGGGSEGEGGNITINGGTVIATGGSGSGSGGGGSGIGGGGGSGNSSGIGGGGGGNITINGGTVIATGGGGIGIGSGIGGGGGGMGMGAMYGGNGGIVKISGASTKVTAAGGAGGFDVGGGKSIGTSYGGGGNLSVADGAMLEMKNTGTNAVNPEYKNCTIIDKDGESVEYSINGLPIAAPALLLEVSPKGSVALPNTGTLTATLSGAVPDNTGKKIKFTIGTTTHTVSTDGFGKASCTVSNLALGTYNFGASFESDEDNYSASATEITGYIVVLGTQDVLSITGLDSAYTYGSKAFDLSTSGGSGTGAVNFVSGKSSIASVMGNTVTIQRAGTFTITAAKNGDSNYAGTKVTSPAVTVHRATPNMSLTASGSTTIDPLILTATVPKVGTGRTPAGTVTFKEGNTSLYSGSLDGDGKAVHTVSNPTVGSHTYTVEYSGQTGYYKSNSTSTTFTIAKENIPSGGESSGNSSDNSGTNQIQQPTVDAPNPSTVGKITPSVTVNKDGKVTVSVSDGDIQSAIDRAVAQAKEDGTLANGIAVSIDLTGLKTQFNTLPLTLSRTVYQKLVDAGVEYLSVVTPQISLSLDLETLKTIYTNAIGNVTIRAVRAENRKLPAGMKNRPAYDLTIVSGGRQISDFGKGNIAITLPYTLKRTEQGGNLQMAYVDTEGKVQNMTHSSYNANQSVMIGRTNHFTVFGIVKKPAPAYKDIEGHWAKDDILFVASRKLLSGTGNNQFSPNTGMTRGMFVTALGRLSGVDPAQYKNTKFSDVAETAYYAPYVAWAAEKGIVNGVTDTTFVPDTNISREQMAVIMYNYAKTIGYTVPKTCEAVTFADNGSIESWAKEAVKAMQMAGVLNGKDGSNFDPKASATRAEVSAVLRRFVEIVIDPATAGGWVKNDSGHWLYYKDGKILGGWQTIGKLRYYFNGDGVMHEGWKQDTNTNKWYYWTTTGATTGWREIGGKRYYFDENGVMAVNTKIDGYEVGPDGTRK